jgi:hypothetical protein
MAAKKDRVTTEYGEEESTMPTSVSHSRHDLETADSRLPDLFKIGGLAALITAVLIPLQIAVFIAWPPPLQGPIVDWFTLFHSNWLLGLLSLDLFLLFDYVLLIPIVLSLYFALRQHGRSFMVMGVACFFVAITCYFASNTAFEMLALSNRYAAATTEAQKTLLLAAGQAMLATYQGTAFHVSYLLGSIAGILMSVVMLRSADFSKVAAHAGIWGNLVGLGLYIPKIGISLSAGSGLVLWIWYILLGRNLLKLGRTAAKLPVPRGAHPSR